MTGKWSYQFTQQKMTDDNIIFVTDNTGLAPEFKGIGVGWTNALLGMSTTGGCGV